MEFMSYLAPAAFVFALAALAQVGSLRQEIQQLKAELTMLAGEEERQTEAP